MTTYTEKHKAYYLANREAILAKRSERERKWIATPKGKFSIQKRKAKQRNIPWLLSFEDWWSIWQESGKWEERGSSSSNFVMCRYKDLGPYSKENVFIATMGENGMENYLSMQKDSLGRLCKKEVKDIK